ncbi:hypothetical protein [Ferrimonas pelagia]|uniref:Uncharacterized protein n=1 Tax=Ferrimonas pelagia TaxID=1177826 RepID=A0ABP9F1H0_9GAMM
MFLVSHFPQVPIATSNPATEQAAKEAQHRPPISRPEALEKSTAERALDPKHEQARVERRDPDGGEQSQSQSQSERQPPKRHRKETLKELLDQARPLLRRPGQVRQPSELDFPYHPAVELSADEYARFAQVVDRFYRRVAKPQVPPAFTVRT